MPSIHTLLKIAEEANDAHNLEQALRVITTRVRQVLDVDVCSVYLFYQQEHRSELVMMANQGLNPEAVGAVRLQAGEGLVGQVAERQELFSLENASAHPSYHYFPELGEKPYEKFLGVPIMHQGQSLGVLVVQAHERVFSLEDGAFLTTLAAQLASAIPHARYTGELEALQSSHMGSMTLSGVPGAPGVGIGQVAVCYREANLHTVPDRLAESPDFEKQRFLTALSDTQDDLRRLAEDMRGVLPSEECALFDAYVLMLESDTIVDDTVADIETGLWAPAAWRNTIVEHARVFESMDDSYLAERANDIRDLGVRVLQKLINRENRSVEFPAQTVLVGEELTATQLAEVPADKLVAVVSEHGSGSSHVAILANALGVPAVMGVNNLPVSHMDGCRLIVDGYSGRVHIEPEETVEAEYRRFMEEESAIRDELSSLADQAAITTDGLRISLYANSGLLADAPTSQLSGAEGIGLYRTEIPFQIRDRFPSEQEQFQLYSEVLEAYRGKPVVLRTLDVGGDKALSYFPIEEDNPFLGWRGIRISLDHPELFITQARAMMRANIGRNNLQVLLPMISSVAELTDAMILLRRAWQEIQDETGQEASFPAVGAMIEVPSAIYQIEAICREVDFISIGTNDLTQYLLAVDRNNERVADIYSTLHPAVLKAMMQIVEGASRMRTPVSVCGELAGDPLGALALLGMGIESLSMSPGSLLKIKKVILSYSASEAVELLNQALLLEDPFEVRDLLEFSLEEHGLGGLVRAGR